jgi:hypothetical protein
MELKPEAVEENDCLQEDSFLSLLRIHHLGRLCCVPSRALELLIPALFYLHQQLVQISQRHLLPNGSNRNSSNKFYHNP